MLENLVYEFIKLTENGKESFDSDQLKLAADKFEEIKEELNKNPNGIEIIAKTLIKTGNGLLWLKKAHCDFGNLFEGVKLYLDSLPDGRIEKNEVAYEILENLLKKKK
jgi:hypothetical protein